MGQTILITIFMTRGQRPPWPFYRGRGWRWSKGSALPLVMEHQWHLSLYAGERPVHEFHQPHRATQ